MSGETSFSGVCQIHYEHVGTCELVAQLPNVSLNAALKWVDWLQIL